MTSFRALTVTMLNSIIMLSIFYNIIFVASSTKTTQSINTIASSKNTIITPLKNKQNDGYYLILRTGETTNNNLFEMLLDISTPWTWVPDVDCSNCFRTNLRSKYYDCDYNNKTCFQNEFDGPKNLSYPSGSVYAFNGYDQINFVGLPADQSVNHNISFGTKVSEDFYNIDADGVFALGKNDDKEVSLIIDLLYEKNWISERSFALFLTNDDQSEDGESQIIFGGYNPAKIVPNHEFQVVPATNQHSWSIELEGLKLGEEDLVISPTNVILSTTFSSIAAPKEELVKVVEKLNNLGIACRVLKDFPNYVCPCVKTDLSNFPDLKFELRGETLVLPSSIYMSVLGLDLEDENDQDIERFENCVVDIQDTEISGLNKNIQNNWVFGRSVLRYYHTLFDLENETIGFALANGSIISEDFSFTPLILMLVIVTIFLSLACIFMTWKCIQIKNKVEQRHSSTNAATYTAL